LNRKNQWICPTRALKGSSSSCQARGWHEQSVAYSFEDHQKENTNFPHNWQLGLDNKKEQSVGALM
jgi:hypothetical protein